jgi:formate hydrogenlyase subunit 3/multisubunit Na+/H+ antiporter MnhD subunit
MKDIITIISLPVLAGLILFLVPDRFKTAKGIFALLVTLTAGYFSIRIYGTVTQSGTLDQVSNGMGIPVFGIDLFNDSVRYAMFRFDNLSKLISVFISLFAVLILLYSMTYIKERRVPGYYSWFLLTIGCSFGAVLSDNLLLFLTFWGILGITLYKLIPGKSEESSATAKKTLILIGASDTIMIIGIALLWKLTGSLNMSSISVPTDNVLSVTAFIALIVGSYQSCAFPFHSWVPDYTKDAPASSSALLPASLDKLLGIYFLARLTTGMFILSDWITFILLATGVITIISAVMMALIQHNYKRLLGFHAVSQVGYMILGFGLGSVIGVAAGLFHMINHALYKSGLLLSAGCIEYRTGEERIDELGGLSKAMPVTFFATIIFAMSISGVPPLNGFASKWMIYQGINDFGTGSGVSDQFWILYWICRSGISADPCQFH